MLCQPFHCHSMGKIPLTPCANMNPYVDVMMAHWALKVMPCSHIIMAVKGLTWTSSWQTILFLWSLANKDLLYFLESWVQLWDGSFCWLWLLVIIVKTWLYVFYQSFQWGFLCKHITVRLCNTLWKNWISHKIVFIMSIFDEGNLNAGPYLG